MCVILYTEKIISPDDHALKDLSDMSSEVWRPIPIPEVTHLYEVSDLGKVRNIKTQRIMKGKIDKDGYWQVCMHARGMKYKKSLSVHRLVALAFIPQVKYMNQVDHIDQDRTNNCAYNLRWCDSQINNCNRKDQSQFGAHLTEMTLRKHDYWRINFHARGVNVIKNFNKNDMTLENAKRFRDILAEDLGFVQPL